MTTTFNDEIESAEQAIKAYNAIIEDMQAFVDDLDKYDKNIIDIKFYKATNRIIKTQYRECVKNRIELQTSWDGEKSYRIGFYSTGAGQTIKTKTRNKEEIKQGILDSVYIIKGWLKSYIESINEFQELNKNEKNILKDLKAVFEKYNIKNKKFQFIEKNKYNF